MKFSIRKKNGRTTYRLRIGTLLITIEFPVVGRSPC